MPRLPREQIDSLAAAIRSHEFLHRVLRQIEISQRTVFHANERADWTLTRNSAEQMLIAELALRYRGDIDQVYFKLRGMEKTGKDWAAAINELASAIHSYYTTPLGMVLRRDLFGDQVVFLSADDAQNWMEQAPASTAARNRRQTATGDPATRSRGRVGMAGSKGTNGAKRGRKPAARVVAKKSAARGTTPKKSAGKKPPKR